MISTARRTLAFVLLAVHASFVLLAPAPQFHHCSELQAAVRCHAAGRISLLPPAGHEPAPSDCPACTISGLSAVAIAAQVLSAPADRTDRLVTPAAPALRSPAEQSAGSRAPPAA